MNIDPQYLTAALNALSEAQKALYDGTPEQRGHAIALCITASINIEVRMEKATGEQA